VSILEIHAAFMLILRMEAAWTSETLISYHAHSMASHLRLKLLVFSSVPALLNSGCLFRFEQFYNYLNRNTRNFVSAAYHCKFLGAVFWNDV